ncbi:bacteriocin immunity protein [Bacillus glycinifermentans]|uniref:Bacteriocin immunity protein n=2 Tax=Bacillus glycinifermentans TaxID=1664069 RepID=A0ABU6H2E5_9BACI|nr:bacteriocin immunity protein [Bacillus glycinifermentans]MEC0485172.1 bacteriocin immunity protein [Bacillus glycinifermentans]UOY89107.1 bacteriocin immunity protein [Bacillus glycinifermentans]
MISMSKKELVSLVEKLMNPEIDDETLSEYIDMLEKNVPHPAPSDLIFWSEEDYSAEQIVDIALNYKE